MLAQQGVERLQVFPHELLKVLCRFVAALLQLFPHGRLLRGRRKIRTALELVEQIVDLLQQHRRPAAVVLPAAGELELQQGSLDAGELLPEVVRGFADRFRGVVSAQLLPQGNELCAKRLDLVHRGRQGVHLVVQRCLFPRLRLNVDPRAGGMRILQHGQLLREFFFSHIEGDRVGSRQGQYRHASHGRRLAPAFRSQRNIRGVERRGSQANFRAAIGAQVPPHAIDARFGFARRRFDIGKILILGGLFDLSGTEFRRAAFDLAHFLAAGVCDGQLGHVLFSQVGLEIEINGRAVRWIFSRRWVVLDSSRLRHLLKAIRIARRKQMCLGRADLRRKLLERGNVVQNPEAAPVSGHRQIVEPLLNGQPVDRRVRQAGLERLPVLPVVEGNIQPALRA